MNKDELLQRASKSSEYLSRLSESARENLRRETDWSGSRMAGYEASSRPKSNY